MRLLRFFLLFLGSTLLLGTTFATFSFDDFVTNFQSQQASLSLGEKQSYSKKVLANLNILTLRNRKDKEQKDFYTSLISYVTLQLENISVVSKSSSSGLSHSLVSSGLDIPNVDLVKVRTVWLALHNAERANKSLPPFAYSSVLEGTASTRGLHLVALGKVNHLRKNTDSYYSYESIKERFSAQGVVFSGKEKDGQGLFTENLGRGYYTCKKADCTDDFIKAIKTSRNFFMSEKNRAYRPHYNAIVKNFSLVGLGVALVGNKYYLVSHYAQALK